MTERSDPLYLLRSCIYLGASINKLLLSDGAYIFEVAQGDFGYKLLDPPDCMCLPTKDGLYVEMTAENSERPRAILTPWGAWFCFSHNILLGELALDKLASDGIVLEKASEPVHDKQGQLIYAVRSYDDEKLPEPSLMAWQTDTDVGLRRLAQWCKTADRVIPGYLDWLRKHKTQMQVDELIGQVEQAALG